jgi:uncharacterized membrane protein
LQQEIWEIISVFLLSTIKFVFGAVPMALAMGFSFFETVVVTSLGGFTGVIVFVFLSDTLVRNFKKRKEQKKDSKEIEVVKKKFTRKNKLIVTIKKRFGIVGISLATPLLLSIPLGCFLAVRYFKNKQEIIAYMFGSILFWSVSIASFKLLF